MERAGRFRVAAAPTRALEDADKAAAPPHDRLVDRIRRRLLSIAASYRLRILAWFILLLGLGTAATVAVIGEVLLRRIDEGIQAELVQEREEFAQLAGGNDPATGEPFADDVARIFDVFLERNVPSRYEVFVTFLDGRLHRHSAPDPRFPLHEYPPFVAAVRDSTDGQLGRIASPVGAVDYLAVPVRVDDEVRGVFAVATFHDLVRAEQNDVLRAATSVGLVLLVIGSLLAWRLADRVLAPVRRTTMTARSISETDLTRRVEVRGHDEVAELATTFNEMLDRVSSAFDAQRRFMDDAGHELRTPITIVRGHLELLEEGSRDERERAMELVLDELERMARLVNELITLAASSRPDFVHREPLQSGELVQEVLEKARVLGDREWHVETARTGTLRCDRQRITQAMLQLAENAVHHTRPGDAIHIGTDMEGGVVRLWVRDTGAGIPAEEQEAIFQRFYRATGSDRSKGTGLGLSIVRAIAEAHGGRATVTSRPGSGATFTLEIPTNDPARATDAR